jgi:UDP-N-acetylglucosamine 2-epimerase (non-hydrolysing)
MSKILVAYGTRPEWVKIKPILKLLNKDKYDIVFTGQHKDLIDKDDQIYDFSIDILESKSRLDSIISSILNKIDFSKYNSVLVQGDTSTAFGVALSAFNNKCKIIHLEAGLRTNDLQNPYPEEGYRQMISRISDIHLCPTELSKQNLLKENISNNIYVVGNTVLDNLIEYKSKAYCGEDVLITLHRNENLQLLQQWIQAINKCVDQSENYYKYIGPLHPNPQIQQYKHLISPKIKIIEPLDHNNLINILVECAFIVTDSGGLQEEGTFLNKKIIVCRKNTERPEGIESGNIYLCDNPNSLPDLYAQVYSHPYIKFPRENCVYGDGKSSEQIIKILKEHEIL